MLNKIWKKWTQLDKIFRIISGQFFLENKMDQIGLKKITKPRK